MNVIYIVFWIVLPSYYPLTLYSYGYQICEGRRMNPKMVRTNFGELIGMVKYFKDNCLYPVDVFYGIHYTSTSLNTFKIMSALGSVKKWIEGLNQYISRAKEVCWQRTIHETELSKLYPPFYIDQMLRKAPFTVIKSESCLRLNLYVPRLGKHLKTYFGILNIIKILFLISNLYGDIFTHAYVYLYLRMLLCKYYLIVA